VGAYAASHLHVDEHRIGIFNEEEPIYRADRVINAHTRGTNALDIVVEASEPEGLLEPEVLWRMEALQNYALGLPHVGGATSIVDYLKQMNKAMNGDDQAYYALPDSRELAAQYLLLYSFTADPTDLEHLVDYEYQLANIRVTLDSGNYQHIAPVVNRLEDYIREKFNTPEASATLSGRVTMNYYWIRDLEKSHFTGLWLALIMVGAVSMLLLRSLPGGLVVLLPVAGSVLFVYASMVLLGIDLGVGTSMFAAVAIGLGVDYAIHTYQRLEQIAAENSDLDQILAIFFRTTGRALFYNFLAVTLGFGVLIWSKVVPLNNFGSIVVLAVTVSFLFSVTLLPSMLKVLKPRFILGADR
jgi:predicted RND superfamily exporter protein